ncbi:EAL domain-containing protein [Ethanoligenens harbinense]|uniref:Diguanylate cyclase/phosphodiesterase with extracellular sensor n=1 Tax=Ethanoligenens harbinense (strain DSM 18485 / JCM 12961 / CGMCC 1.5033 / YUAN-3) TaxID=663278 RepID=E6U3D4_ETHHY|nr:EAL domain-containing protein [Ethanoligenens harbinense]ADU26426.1 diguanylate cyclase/phosphodiesterase with extracellular sensor [Ethanoligenens harbinense YUAN-3]AVQ95547.1 HAMP domain-containing protein [Ethanoligenens harbinense YUAN-3]AYF38211.1 HAMP domain-containing protein [Ethanoligenens harbinense]AYF40956.1 HAMP domain-containing protein [Ethanoligenens harbinense]QCN91789.1 EAL domain-containing protein [Ethanoligenens harbinense]
MAKREKRLFTRNLFKGIRFHIVLPVTLLMLGYAVVAILLQIYSLNTLNMYNLQNSLRGQSNFTMQLLDQLYPGEWANIGGALYKGDHRVTGDTAIVDMVQRETGYAATIYEGVWSVSTNIANGNQRLLGFPMDKAASSSVLTRGKQYLGIVKIADVPYIGYYVPLKDADGNVVGAILTAKSQEEERTMIQNQVTSLLVVLVALLMIAIFLVLLSAMFITNPLDFIVRSMDIAKDGVYSFPFPEKLRRRTDEIGKLVRSFERLFDRIDGYLNAQKLITETSTDFISVNRTNLNAKLDSAVMRIGSLLQIDTVCICLDGTGEGSAAIRSEWHRPNASGAQHFPVRYADFFSKDQVHILPDIHSLPEEEAVFKQQLLDLGLRCLLSVPVLINSGPAGRLILASGTSGCEWDTGRVNVIRALAQIIADGLAKVRAYEKIEFMAYYDNLTKLPNRSMFYKEAGTAIRAAQQGARQVGVMFLDLDSFKSINDTMGHQTGDRLIRDVAQTLSRQLSDMAVLARFGGDEFLVLCPAGQGEAEIRMIADRIMTVFKRPFLIKGNEVFITASMGIALFPQDGEDPESLIKHADIAMYQAKEKGKNQYAICSAEMKRVVQENVLLANDLYHALDRNELEVYYQPQVDIRFGRIVGLEALLRWHHPSLGMVPPSVFVPLAEQTGLINPIGRWVLETACRQCRRWYEGDQPVHMAVNISIVQLLNADVADQISRILRQTGLEPHALELEVTESVTLRETEATIYVLQQLKALGISLSIDDFGTKYSSLNRLKQLPIDKLKMDIQFVRGIGRGEKDRAIVRAIINLAKSLDLRLIAEGVETQAEWDFLKENLCNEVQGYYYYKPMPAEQCGAILKHHNG